MKKCLLLAIAFLLVIIPVSAQLDPPEILYGTVTFSDGTPAGSAHVTAVFETAADGDADADTYTATTDNNGLYMVQVQWRGQHDQQDGDPLKVTALRDDLTGSVATATGFTPMQVDVTLGKHETRPAPQPPQSSAPEETREQESKKRFFAQLRQSLRRSWLTFRRFFSGRSP